MPEALLRVGGGGGVGGEFGAAEALEWGGHGAQWGGKGIAVEAQPITPGNIFEL